MTHVPSSPFLSTAQRALLVALTLVLLVLNTWAVYNVLTSRASIVVWDFHTPWLGLRAMLRDGRDMADRPILMRTSLPLPTRCT
jgi:hypothetical protein